MTSAAHRLPSMVAAAILLSALSGCAVVTPRPEYEAYRASRLAPSEDERLLASRAYLRSHPEGRWADEMRARLEGAEVALFEARGQGRSGLTLYLDLYPEGTFADQARARLAALAVVEQRAAGEAASQAARAEDLQARDLELRRTWLSRFAQDWLRLFAGLSSWRAPLAQVAQDNPEFSEAFGRPPRPRCTQEECVKYYTAAYAIAVPGATRMERTAQLLLRLQLSGGKLVRAELLMPGWGFSRWVELEENRLVVDADVEERAQAVRWAFDKLKQGLSEHGEVVPAALVDFTAPKPPSVGPNAQAIDTASLSPATAVLLPGSGEQANASAAASDMLSQPSGVESDLVLSPIEIGADGTVSELAAVPGRASEPGGETQQEGDAVITELPATSLAERGGTAVRYRVGGVVVTFFAAGPLGAGNAYDGVVIEPSD